MKSPGKKRRKRRRKRRRLAPAVIVLLACAGAAEAQRYRLGEAEKPRRAPPAPSVEEEEPKLDKETIRRFRMAVAVLGRSSNTRDLVGAARTLRDGYPESRPFVIDAAVRAKASRARVFALGILAEKGNADEDMETVRRALADTVASVRLAAVRAVERFGVDGFPVLAEYLPEETEPNNRKMAVKALERWNDPAAVPLLVRLLRREKHSGVRNFIVTALERLSGRELGDDADRWEAYARALEEQARRERLARLLKSQNGPGRDTESKRRNQRK